MIVLCVCVHSQAREVFMKQRWLGVAAMQQPFDFLAIANIIYETQPDVILETGEGGVSVLNFSVLCSHLTPKP